LSHRSRICFLLSLVRITTSLTLHFSTFRFQILRVLASIHEERGELDVALDFAHRAVQEARELFASDVDVDEEGVFMNALRIEADILESLGRLDEAMALDAEWHALSPNVHYPEASIRRAMKHVATGEDTDADPLLRSFIDHLSGEWYKPHTSKRLEVALRPIKVLAELLERRGTEEALAEARTLRDGVAQQLARHEARRAAALEETRAAAAEAVRQWRGEALMSREPKTRGKGTGKGKKKGKKKGRRGKAKAQAKGSSSAAAIEGEPPREPAGGQAEEAAVEGAAAAEVDQEAKGEESQPQEEEEEEERQECAICLQDLELEDDEDPWGDEGGESEPVVMLRCGHRFHEICGDMWCAKCADKGWGVTCPGCRAPYVLVRR
jgi:tetratricopeptide (TPR) repeat protein